MIIECETHGTVVEYNTSHCTRCSDAKFKAEHNGVDRVTDFMFPGLKHFLARTESK